jgi:dTDP-4-dehydrorhamnose reductase
MDPMKILLFGSEGQVGWELQRTLACLGTVTPRDRVSDPVLDLSDFGAVRNAIQTLKPDLIVNAAAYTAVDKAEQETEIAHRINGTLLEVLAEAAVAVDAAIVHYSTDYVFPGNSAIPYREDDPVGPMNVYGKSKLAGEAALRQSGARHLILRTAWVYGRRGNNFLLTMLRLLKERQVLHVVDDQRGTPTWSRLIAEATAQSIRHVCRSGCFDQESLGGTYHLTCSGETTWYGFARRIRDLGIRHGVLPESCARLEPIPTSGYPTLAGRPEYSVLDNSKLTATFRLALPDWSDALELCLAD